MILLASSIELAFPLSTIPLAIACFATVEILLGFSARAFSAFYSISSNSATFSYEANPLSSKILNNLALLDAIAIMNMILSTMNKSKLIATKNVIIHYKKYLESIIVKMWIIATLQPTAAKIETTSISI